jgi:transposase
MVITKSDTSPLAWVLLSVAGGMLTGEMTRHTTFRFCLDPTLEQHEVLARHAGAARFAFNQCLRMVKTALTQRRTDPGTDVPWSGFDLINAFNAWKKTEDAGRVFTVGADGVAEVAVTGLAWRGEVCQQVFEEAAVDLGKGLTSWSDSRSGKRTGKRIGFPRFKKKTGEGAVVSAAQQVSQRPACGDPRRRQRSAALAHPARYRRDRGA